MWFAGRSTHQQEAASNAPVSPPAHERHNEGIQRALVAPLDERALLRHAGTGPPTSPAIASSWGLGNILIASSGHNRGSHCGSSLLKKAVPVALQCLQFRARCPLPFPQTF